MRAVRDLSWMIVSRTCRIEGSVMAGGERVGFGGIVRGAILMMGSLLEAVELAFSASISKRKVKVSLNRDGFVKMVKIT